MSSVAHRGRQFNVVDALSESSSQVFSDSSRWEQAKTYKLLTLLADGEHLSSSVCHKLSANLWQVRAKTLRVLYFFDEHDIVVCHVYRKKSNKLPLNVKRQAEQKRNAYLREK